MAVELRCPDCRAKLRLKAAPDPGTDVECPKCGTVFPAPEPEPEPEPEEDAPKEKAEKKEKKKKKEKPKDAAPAGPKKRKAKKRETSKTALIAVIALGSIMLLSMGGVLIWFFTRTSKSVEMMFYVPDDAYDAFGVNLGHAQKYPEFYKSAGGIHNNTDYKAVGDAAAKAGGLADMDALSDYVVRARNSSGGWAVVLRTKAEFDEGSLSKVPGAAKGTLDGKTYYTVTGLIPGGEPCRLFAPTNRLIVACATGKDAAGKDRLSDAAFKKMLNGHGDNKEGTLGVRMGELGKRVTRGTFWRMVLFDKDVKSLSFPAPPKEGTGGQGADDPKQAWQRTVTEGLNGSKGYGMKASLGSRELRFEMIAWYKDSEKPVSTARKWKDSELGKGDEGEPPRWFKDKTNGFGDRKAATQLLSNIGFGATGELFYAKSAVDTLDIQQGASGAITKVLDLNTENQGAGGGGGPAGGPPPGGPGKAPRVRRPHRARR
jgi:hypothetical protein